MTEQYGIYVDFNTVRQNRINVKSCKINLD